MISILRCNSDRQVLATAVDLLFLPQITSDSRMIKITNAHEHIISTKISLAN